MSGWLIGFQNVFCFDWPTKGAAELTVTLAGHEELAAREQVGARGDERVEEVKHVVGNAVLVVAGVRRVVGEGEAGANRLVDEDLRGGGKVEGVAAL